MDGASANVASVNLDCYAGVLLTSDRGYAGGPADALRQVLGRSVRFRYEP